MHSPIENIHNLLVHIRRLQKRSWAFAALVTGTTFVLLILTISSLVETFTWLSPAGRMPLVTGTLGIILLGSLAALTTLTVLLILKKFPDNKTIARTIWNRDSEIRDRILDAIELENLSNTNSSDSLRFAALELIDNESKKLDPHNYIRTGLFKKSIRTGAWVGAAIILILLVGGRAISDAAIRLINPNTVYLKPGTVLLSLDMPDTVTVIQGDSIMLSVLAFHHLPDEVTFFLDEGSGSIKTINAVSVTIENADNPVDSSRYVAQATNTQRNFSVYAQAGKAISNTAAVIVVPRPRIARLELTLFPPSYTKLEPLHLPEGVGDVRGLPGTHALVKLESSRPLKNAELVIAGMDSESSSIFLETEDRKASGRFLVKNNGNWWVNLVADDDVPGDEPLRWSIDLMEDYPPHVEVILPEDGAIIPESMTLPFVTVVDDDYGISKANLRFRVYNELLDPDSVGEEAFAIIPLRGKVSAPGRFEVRTLWGLSDLPLLPTEEVHYFVEAWDNDAWKGAKRVRSELRRVIFPSLDDLFALSREEEINVSEGIEEVMERAEDIRQKVEKTLERLKSNPEDLSWEESQSLQQSVNSQQELLEQLEKAAQTLEELKNAFEEHDMVNSELLEKYQKLQQLMEEISTPELRQAMEELSQAIQNQDGEKIRDALEQFAQDQENFIKSLDRSLAILEQLKAERRIEELASRAEDLAQREKELSDRLENDPSIDSEREALRQQQLENEFSSLMEEMKKAAEEFAKDYPELSDSLNNLSDEVEEDNLGEKLSEVTDQLRSSETSNAAKSSKQNAKSLQQMADRLAQMQQSMVEQSKQEIAEDMDRIMEGLLLVSRRQELLRNESRQLGVASPRYRDLAARQVGVSEGLDMSARAAAELTKKTFFVGAKLLGELESARRHMERALSQYTDRRPRDVTGEQGKSLAAIHRGLRDLDNAKQSMEQSGSSTGYQEMMEQLSQMAAQQQAMNQASQSMPMPMPGSSPGGDQLSQMAARQQAMANAMRKIENQAQSMEEILGSLEGLGDAMDAVAKDMEDKNITNRTRKLQKRILQRLLDSQKSLQEREFSRERLSRTGRDFQRISPGSLKPEEQNLLREKMLRALESDFLPAWKPVIRDYFRALEKDTKEKPDQK